MKLTIYILIFSFFGLVSNAQTDSIRGEQFKLQGKLISEVKETPLCGIMAWGGIAEFEIIEFSDARYSEKKIPIILTCPASYSKSFKVGKTYLLNIVDENQADFEWGLWESDKKKLNNYNLENKYWLLDFKKVSGNTKNE